MHTHLNSTEQKVRCAVDAFTKRHNITEGFPICHKIKQCYQLPFYQWKITKDENMQIKELLDRADKKDFMGTCPIYRLLFCLYVSEWIKYNHHGGQINWADITRDIETLKNINKTNCVTKTFDFLGRNIIPNCYLYTLARESGFPIGLLKKNKYRQYFKNVVNRRENPKYIPTMYKDNNTQKLWREIADGFMALKYSTKADTLNGDMFRYYDIDIELYDFLKRTQKETQSHRFKIEFSLHKNESDFELYKKISVPKKIKIQDSAFIEILVANRRERSAWYDKNGWEETISPITLNGKHCLDPVDVTIGENPPCTVTQSPYNAPAGADLTETILYFIGDKDSNVFTYYKQRNCKTELNKWLYALYPKHYTLDPQDGFLDIKPYNIFDGYKIIKISGNIDFYDIGQICVGSVSDDYQDIAQHIRYNGNTFNTKVRIGTQRHPVYKGLPSVEIDGKTRQFNACRKSAKDKIEEFSSLKHTLMGRSELFYLDENNKVLATLTCIILPENFDIVVPHNATHIGLPDCVKWTDTQEKSVTGLDVENIGTIKCNMHLSNQEKIVVTIDLDEKENVFYKSGDVYKNDIKLKDRDVISLRDIDQGAYVKPFTADQEISVNNNDRRTHKIPKRKFYLSNIKQTILNEMLLGYSDKMNQENTVVSIIGEYADKKSIEVSPYHWKIKVSGLYIAEIYDTSKKCVLTTNAPTMRFIDLDTNKVHKISEHLGEYNLNSISSRGAGILFVPDTDHIKPKFYSNNFKYTGNIDSLKSIVLDDTAKRTKNIAKRYSQMIQNPKEYGVDRSYMETLLTAMDYDLPVRDMDVFKAWYNCPDIVPALYVRYVADNKMQQRIKRIIEKNGFQLELISYVAYKDLYKVLLEHIKEIVKKSVIDVYGDDIDCVNMITLYYMENGVGFKKDIENKTVEKILNLFPNNKILHRLLFNANGKNYLDQNEKLHDKIRNMYIDPIEEFEKGDTKAFADRLAKIIESFACEHKGQVNNYTEKNFVQLNRVYNDNTQTRDVQKWIDSKYRYEKVKTDYVDWIANDLNMDEFKKGE